MNYYKRHIGDYMKDAGHLSLLEHGVYTRLLDVYYGRESGIPVDQAARLVGARTPDEMEALAQVTKEFFSVADGCYMQGRCDIEIGVMQDKAETNRVVGKLGGRPRKETNVVLFENPKITQTVSKNNPDVTLATSHKPLPIINTVPTVLVESGDPLIDPSPEKVRIPCPSDELLELYHAHCPALPRVLMLNAARRKHLVSRWRDVDAQDNLATKAEGLSLFQHFFAQVQRSDFLCGRTNNKHGRVWKASFDWLVLPTNFLKVFEGQYDNERRTA